LLADFVGLPSDDETYPRDDRRPEKTWILLHHEDTEKNEVRSELSLPIGQNADGSITTWSDRIPLARISTAPSPVISHAQDGEAIVVPVERRAE